MRLSVVLTFPTGDQNTRLDATPYKRRSYWVRPLWSFKSALMLPRILQVNALIPQKLSKQFEMGNILVMEPKPAEPK